MKNWLFLLLALSPVASAQLYGQTEQSPVRMWVTSGDGSRLLAASGAGFAEPGAKAQETIAIDPAQTFQTIEGFGYTLTGGSAMLLHQMEASKTDRIAAASVQHRLRRHRT